MHNAIPQFDSELRSVTMHGLVDAHRHGLYDISDKLSLAGVPVQTWESNKDFQRYETMTKALTGDELISFVSKWIEVSSREGVTSILDWSGKHDRYAMRKAYESNHIESFSPLLWSKYDRDQASTGALILPDERGLSEFAAEVARSFLADTDGICTLHAMQSEYFSTLAKKRFGCSTVKWLKERGLLCNRLLLVHMNAASEEDFALVASSGARVVLCPVPRFALSDPDPIIPDNVILHFGTDAPIVSSERNLLWQGYIQHERWVAQGQNYHMATGKVLRALYEPIPGSRLRRLADKEITLMADEYNRSGIFQ